MSPFLIVPHWPPTLQAQVQPSHWLFPLPDLPFAGFLACLRPGPSGVSLNVNSSETPLLALSCLCLPRACVPLLSHASTLDCELQESRNPLCWSRGGGVVLGTHPWPDTGKGHPDFDSSIPGVTGPEEHKEIPSRNPVVLGLREGLSIGLGRRQFNSTSICDMPAVCLALSWHHCIMEGQEYSTPRAWLLGGVREGRSHEAG